MIDELRTIDGATEDQLLAALQAALSQAEGADAPTSRELARRLSVGIDRVMAALHKLDEAGQLEVVTVTRRTITGYQQRRPGYRLKP